MSIPPIALPPPVKTLTLAESVKMDDTSKVVEIWNMQRELVRKQREQKLAAIKPSASTKNLDPNTNS